MGTSGIQDSEMQNEVRQLKARIAELEAKETELNRKLESVESTYNHFEVLSQKFNKVFWLKDIERNKLLYVSKGYEQVWGRPLQELIRNPQIWTDSIHVDDRERIKSAASKEQTLGTYDVEYRIVLPDRSVRWIHSHAYPICNDSGKVHQVTGIAEDITDRKVSQLGLQESEEKFTQIVHHLKQVLWLFCFKAGKNIYVSPAYKNVWGRPCESVYKNPRSWVDAVHPEDRDRVIDTCFNNRPSDDFSLEFRIFHADKTIKWIRNRIFVIRNKKHELYRLAGVAEDITDEKKARDELLMSEHRYRSLVEATSNTVFRIQTNGKSLKENIDWWENLTGQSEVEARGSDGFGWLDVLHPDDRQNARKAWDHAFRGYHKFDFEYRVLTQKKEYKHFNVRLVPVESPLGTGVEFVGTFNDITDRKRSETALAESEDKYRSLFENESDAIIIIESETLRILEVNSAAVKLFGYTKDEFLKLNYLVLSAEHDKSFKLLKMFEAKKQSLNEIPLRLLRKKSGEIIPTEISGSKYLSKGKMMFIWAIRDITERKRAQDAIEERESRLRALVDAIPDKMLRLRKDGYILDCKLPKTSTHFKTSDVNGKYLKDVISPALFKQFIIHVKRAFGNKKIETFEYRIFAGKTNYDYEARFVNVDENEVVVIIRNVTEYRKLQNNMLEFSESYKQRVGQDLHDGLGQHLTGISFLTKVLAQKIEGIPTLNKEANEAQRIVNYVNDAITRTREMAKGLYPVELEKDGFCSAVTEMAAQTEKVFSVKCQFKSKVYHENLPPLASTHLYRIVQESIHNAIKHGKAHNIQIRLDEKGNQYVLTIKDDGIGLFSDSTKVKGMGIEIMKHRCRAIGATFGISHIKPHGAIVMATFNPNLTLVKQKRYAKN